MSSSKSPPRQELEASGSLEPEHWADLTSRPSTSRFRQAWLTIQCQQIPRTVAGLLLAFDSSQKRLEPAAMWPSEGFDFSRSIPLAERCLDEPVPFTANGGDGQSFLVAPVMQDDRVRAVVCLCTTEPAATNEQLSKLIWGIRWLEADRTDDSPSSLPEEQVAKLLSLISAALEHDSFLGASSNFLGKLSVLFDCDRVSLGLEESGTIKLRSVSNSSRFDERSNLTRAVEGAMTEATDQETHVSYPAIKSSGIQITRQHEELAKESEAASILSIPTFPQGAQMGVLLLERAKRNDSPFTHQDVELLTAVATVSVPLLALRYEADRWLGAKIYSEIRKAWRAVFTPGTAANKSAFALALTLLLIFLFARDDYRIRAPVTLEAAELRTLSAPYDGFIATAHFRRGDTVEIGDVLATLEDDDLLLERARVQSRIEQLSSQYRQALADRRADYARIITTQVEQEKINLDITESRISRMAIRSPIDGVIVRGDLSQSLGAPIQKGQVVFEVAPLNQYRPVFLVDERDLRQIQPEQPVEILLSAFPGAVYAATIEKVTPYSVASDGRNAFRVDGTLESATDSLQPGMEGVARIHAGRRSLIWLWTHDLTRWLRTHLFRLMP